MRRTRTILVIMLLSVGLPGAYWGVCAQEGRSRWAPPPMVPPGDLSQPVAQTQPSEPDKVVPAPVPRKDSDVVQAGGVVPPLPLGPTETPAPALPQPSFPTPNPAPPDVTPAPLPTPVNPAPAALPMLDPEKILDKGPVPLAPVKVEESPQKPAVEMNVPAALEPAPMPAPAVVAKPAEVTKPAEAVKSFVLIRLPSPPAPPTPPAQNLVEPSPTPLPAPSPPAQPVMPPSETTAALVRLQTPLVSVEKRSVVALRAGEAQYVIAVRNLGATAAQQVRVEDVLPEDARLLRANPSPQIEGTKAIWLMSNLAPQSEQLIQMCLQGGSTGALNQTSVQVAVGNVVTTTSHASFSPPPKEAMPAVLLQSDTLAVRLLSPPRLFVGKPAVFEIKVTNRSGQPITGLVLYGSLPEGLTTPEGPEIEGAVDGVLQPGETKSLKMPATVVKVGRYTVKVKVTTRNGFQGAAEAAVEIGADALHLQPVQNTRLLVGREADYRIELTNHTSAVIHHVTVMNQLAPGLDFVTASDRGLYQANSRAVHWLIDQMEPGQTKTLMMRVHAAKAGTYPHLVVAKGDGVSETRSSSVIIAESVSNLSLKVIDRDNPLEVGRETVYEIQVQNPSQSANSNVQVQVQFPPGLTPRAAQGSTKYTVHQQTVVFEPLPALGPQGLAIYRVSAVAQTAGDQRVRFAVASEQVRTPVTREISTLVYRGD